MDIGELTNPFKPKPQEEHHHHLPEFLARHHRHSTEIEVNPYQIGDYDDQPAAAVSTTVTTTTTTTTTATTTTASSSKESNTTEEASHETIEVKCPEKNSVERLADMIKEEAHKVKEKVAGTQCHHGV